MKGIIASEMGRKREGANERKPDRSEIVKTTNVRPVNDIIDWH